MSNTLTVPVPTSTRVEEITRRMNNDTNSYLSEECYCGARSMERWEWVPIFERKEFIGFEVSRDGGVVRRTLPHTVTSNSLLSRNLSGQKELGGYMTNNLRCPNSGVVNKDKVFYNEHRGIFIDASMRR